MGVSGARRVIVGRIAGAHGLRGQVRVAYFLDSPEVLLRVSHIELGTSEDDPEATRFKVVTASAGRSGELRVTLASYCCVLWGHNKVDLEFNRCAIRSDVRLWRVWRQCELSRERIL